MELAIEPEPTPAERAAIAVAVEAALAGDSGRKAAWWEAGVRENVDEPPADESPSSS